MEVIYTQFYKIMCLSQTVCVCHRQFVSVTEGQRDFVHQVPMVRKDFTIFELNPKTRLSSPVGKGPVHC